MGEIEQATGIAQPTLSQQLSVLRGARLVMTRRRSKQVFYSLDGDRLGECASTVATLAPSQSASDAPAARSNAHRSRGGAAVFATIIHR